jgi:hypothetical protein
MLTAKEALKARCPSLSHPDTTAQVRRLEHYRRCQHPIHTVHNDEVSRTSLECSCMSDLLSMLCFVL